MVINLCVPTASGVPLDRLPKAIDGVRIIGIDVPGFGVPTHAEAKDVLAGAMLRYARREAEAGPVARPRGGSGHADGDVDRRTVSGRSGRGWGAAGADGVGGWAVRCRRANGATFMARWTARSPRRCIRSIPHQSGRCRRPAGRSSGPGRSGLRAPRPGWMRSATAAGVSADAAKARALPAIQRGDGCQPDRRLCHGVRAMKAPSFLSRDY